MPASERFQSQVQNFQNRKEPGRGRQILGGVLAATRFRGAAPYVSGDAARDRELENIRVSQGAANEEQQNVNHQQDRALRTKQMESMDDSRKMAGEDRSIGLMTSPNLEEQKPDGTYRGTVDIRGKKFGVLPPEVVAGRKRTAEKEADMAAWPDVPAQLQQEFGLAAKAPQQMIDNALRVMEATGRAQEAATLRRETLASQQAFQQSQSQQNRDLQQNIANQNNAVRKDIASEGNQARKDTAQIARDNKPPTAAQSTVATYAARLKNSGKIIDSLSDFGGAEQFFNQRVPDWASFMRTPKGKAFDQASRDIINATLRRESGAVINDQEFVNAKQQYLPQPGDTPEDKARKRNNRLINQQSFINAARGAYEDPDDLLRAAGVNTDPPAAAAGGPKVGTVEDGHRFKGGDPSKPENWEKVR